MQYRLDSFRLTDILVPLRSLSHGNRLWRASWVGALLAVPQAAWVTFLVTYLVVVVGQSLSTAGLVFAAMQTASMLGRVTLGWIADHVASSTTTLAIAALGSAVSTILLGFSTSTWPLWSFVMLAAFAGIAVSGWNGVQIAEVARRSPPELIGETTAGSVILIFMANMLTPVAFAAFVALTGRYDLAFLVCGAFSLVCLPLLYGMGPERASRATAEPRWWPRAPGNAKSFARGNIPNNEGLMYGELGLFIDGAWKKNGGTNKARTSSIRRPRSRWRHLPHASKSDLDEALESAKKGFAVWRATSAYDRCKIMHKAADLMRERHDAISKIMVLEQGKPYAEARGEVIVSADIIDWYAEEGRRSYGRIVPGRGKGVRQLVIQEPIGVVAAFTPWNFPVLTPARKVGGALAAGCSLILKASEETPAPASRW